VVITGNVTCLWKTKWFEGVSEVNDNPDVQGGSNMTGTDLYVKKPHCAAAVRP